MTMDPATLRRQLEEKKAKPKEEIEDAEIASLPASTLIDFDYTTKKEKRRYQGRFLFTVPTLGHIIQITQIKAAMLPNGAAADPIGAFLAEMMCYLEVTLAQEGRPSWWQPHQFYDSEVLAEMYRRCREYERRFRGGAEADAGEDEATSQDGSDSSGEDDVERQVQAPSQRRTPLAAQGNRSDRAGDRSGRPRKLPK